MDEKLPLTSADVFSDRVAALRDLFPEVFTDGKISWDDLRRMLGESVSEEREHYGLNWVGKSEAIQAVQSLSPGTLIPDPEASVDFDQTANAIIEGDNLEVLKLLQKSYHGKVKLIFIDPPYNTGGEFIYPDNFKEGLQDYLRFTGQVNEEGVKLRANAETDGRYHSKWLTMLYPRLFLARNLLKPDGAIFVTIDDHELQNLLHLMDSVFGPENRLGIVAWQKKYATANDTVDFSTTHDYVVAYSRQREYVSKTKAAPTLARLPRTEAMNKPYKNPDNDERGRWKAGDYTCNKTAEERPNLYYEIEQPNTHVSVWPKKTRVWAYEPEIHQKNIDENRVWWGTDGLTEFPAYKRFLSEVKGPVAGTVWSWRECGHTDEARKELIALFPDATRGFDTPKPTRLIQRIIYLASPQQPKATDEPDIVLDFFAGSGTTGHALLKQNLLDGGNRRYIMVQLPQPIERNGRTQDDEGGPEAEAEEEPLEEVEEIADAGVDEALETEFEERHFLPDNIAQITSERMRRVKQVIDRKAQAELPYQDKPTLDTGFRLFRLAASNFKTWDGAAAGGTEQEIAQSLLEYTDHIAPDAAPVSVLFEVLLKAGYPLTSKIEVKELHGQAVYIVAEGALSVCLTHELTDPLIQDVLALNPARVVFLDAAFGANDALKANARLQARARGIDFRTI